MKPKRAVFVTSAADKGGFPPETMPEFAFAGRSNVGKSTLINMVVGRAGLAKTSNTPGRTRLLNWFEVEPQKGKTIAFVDLPGYGYAKVPTDMRDSWRPLVESYLVGRAVLRAVFVLIDARRGAQAEEEELLGWLQSEGIDSIAVITKADKLPKSKRKLVALSAKRDLGLKRDPIITSAQTKDGISELWHQIYKRAG